MEESQKFSTPIFTPSTKAEQGAHDENISPEKGAVVDEACLKSLISTTPQLLN